MGFPTKIHLIKHTAIEQWYFNFPNQFAQSMEIERGKIVEWVIEDKSHFVIKRRNTLPSTVKKHWRIDPGDQCSL
jgi:hypothetical protein